MIPAEKNPLSPRETALRMLEHMHDDVSYGDIVRQVRILQDIDNTLNEVDMAGFPADDAVVQAQMELNTEQREDDTISDRSSFSLRSRSSGRWHRLDEGASHAAHERSLLQDAAWHF